MTPNNHGVSSYTTKIFGSCHPTSTHLDGLLSITVMCGNLPVQVHVVVGCEAPVSPMTWSVSMYSLLPVHGVSSLSDMRRCCYRDCRLSSQLAIGDSRQHCYLLLQRVSLLLLFLLVLLDKENGGDNHRDTRDHRLGFILGSSGLLVFSRCSPTIGVE